MATFEPIAIIGIGCRLPGAHGPDAFWRLLAGGVDAIREVPADRWDLDELFDPDPSAPGKLTTRWGGFLDQIDRFDAGFFAISPREAAHVDPQQRLLMEVAWESLEDAGLPQESLAGQPVGVFMGVSSFDYGAWQLARPEAIVDGYVNTGSALSIAANRLSYLFDWRGPSLVIDTACSSSLVAAYYACLSLDRGECRVALAGGVNLLVSPAATIGFSKLQAMAADGRCKAFDARANGYVRSEGAGVVVLKPLAAALADGDRIYAVIKGGAVNQDGRTNGLTAPNGLSQEALVRDAIASAGLQPSELQYVEAHGTGTSLGDPIELNALGAVLARGRARDARCAVGSVKSNLGHLEAAAGAAGLVKLALALDRRQIPPSLHFEKPNPYIRFDVLPLRVPTALEPWPVAATETARGGVSAFGFGGTNAHLVLEAAPVRSWQDAAEGGACLLPLSARSEAALVDLARAFAAQLTAEDAPSLPLLCATAAVRRTHHDYRLAAVGATRQEMAATLLACAAGERPKDAEIGRRRAGRRPKVAFVFPGQGSQWLGMGRTLVAQEPVFAAAIERCAAAFAPHVDWSLTHELTATPDNSRLGEVDVIQPAIFAIQVALAELWRHWGIQPDAVVGHSMGEAAAAHVAGALSLDDAARIICRRSRLARRMSGKGAMAVVELSLDKARDLLLGYEGRLSVAVSNSPTSTVLAGDVDAMDTVLDGLERDGVFCRRVNVDYASHSPHMDGLRDDLLALLAGISPGRTKVPLYSTVTAAIAAGTDLGADYWARNLREPVLFADTVERIAGDGIDVFLEVSPHPILLPAIQQCLQHIGSSGLVWGSLRREEDERRSLLTTLAGLYAIGRPLEWRQVYPRDTRPVPLPSYPWQRERHWIDESPGAATRRGGSARAAYPLLGEHVRPATPSAAHVWQGELGTAAQPFLADHRVQGQIVVPATAILEMAVEAGEDACGHPVSIVLSDVVFERALVLAEGQPRVVQITLTREMDGTLSWSLFAETPGGTSDAPVFTRHTHGRLQQAEASDAGESVDLEAIRQRCPEARSADEHYRLFAGVQIDYGPAFQGVESLSVGEGEAIARLRAAPADGRRYRLHPALLDAALQVLAAGLSDLSVTLVPVSVSRLRSHRAAPASADGLWAHATWKRMGPRVSGDVRLLTATGELVAEVNGIGLAPLPGSASEAAELFYSVEWEAQAVEGSAPPGTVGAALVFADAAGIGDRLAHVLRAREAAVVMVAPGDLDVSAEAVAAGRCQVDPARPEQFEQLLEALGRHGRQVETVIHLWGLDEGRLDAPIPAPGWMSGLHLVQALARTALPPSARLWVATRGAQAVRAGEDVQPGQARLWGLGRTVMQEHPELLCTLVDLSGDPSDAEQSALAHEILGGTREQQVAVRGGDRFVARVVAAEPAGPDAPGDVWPAAAGNQPMRAQLDAPGALERVVFRRHARRRPAAGEVEIQVVAAGLNFRDVLLGLGLLPSGGDMAFGLECAGRIAAVGDGVVDWRVGDDVVALVKPSLATFVRTPAALVAAKPRRLDFEDAATLPVALLTAYYALNYLGRLQAGERVLIHSATGAVGLACIQLAKAVGAEIYATAGTVEKRRLLEDLGVRVAMDSRSLGFADDVLSATGGEGVDVVVNSLAGPALARSLAILRPGGRFLELGKRDRLEGGQLRLTALEDSRTFALIDLDSLAEKRPDFCGRLLRDALAAFEERGDAPIAKQVYTAGQLGEALHHMARAHHIGKVVIRLDPSDVSPAAPSRIAGLLRDDGTYIVTGGLGGIALVTSRWLVDHGARHLVLVGRRAPSPEAREAIAAMERTGARVVVEQLDVADAAAVRSAFERWAADLPPVRGILHAAGLLDDGILLQQSAARFESVMAPKVAGAWNLHQASRDLPLDLFVLFSSAASMLGSAGQANYAAANQFLDALAVHRRANGLVAVSVNWGPWSEVGLATRPDRGRRLEAEGMKSLTPVEGIAALEQVLLGARSVIGVMRVDWPALRAAQPLVIAQPFFARVSAGEPDRATTSTIRAQVLAASADDRVGLLADRLREHAASVLRLPPSKIDVEQPLLTMGIDSLMAIELKSRVERELGVAIPLLQLVKGPSLVELAHVLLAAMTGDASSPPPPESTPAAGTGKSLLLSLLSVKESGRA